MLVRVERDLWIACAISEWLVCALLRKRRLVRRYRCFFALAFVNATRDVLFLMKLDTESVGYAYAWVATLPILMSVQFAAVLEAYGKLTSQYPGLAAFASSLLRVSAGLLVFASCISVIWTFETFTRSIYDAVLFTYRYFSFVLAGCLAIPCLFLSRLPKPVKQPAKNVNLHLWMLVSYFTIYSAGVACANLFGVQRLTITIINILIMTAQCVLYCSWASVLTPSGEEYVDWPKLDPDLAAIIDAKSASAVHTSQLRWRKSKCDCAEGGHPS